VSSRDGKLTLSQTKVIKSNGWEDELRSGIYQQLPPWYSQTQSWVACTRWSERKQWVSLCILLWRFAHPTAYKMSERVVSQRHISTSRLYSAIHIGCSESGMLTERYMCCIWQFAGEVKHFGQYVTQLHIP